MFPLPQNNININIGGGPNVQGQRGPCGQGRRNPLQKMMRKLMKMMAQLQGGQQNQGCCSRNRPQFGNCGGQQQVQGGFSFQMGASMQGFLG